MRKTTLRDVAKEAGVSVATVSYVLNNVSKQSITEETKQRVYAAANKLNYVQNLTAKALSLGKTNVLGLLFVSPPKSITPKPLSYGVFLDQLERICRAHGYHLLVTQIDPMNPSFEVIEERKLDGAFLINAMEQSFLSISSQLQYGSPLILIDSIVHDSLFRKINPDWQQLFQTLMKTNGNRERYALIYEDNCNEDFHRSLLTASGLDPSCICAATNNNDQLRSFIEQHKDKKLIVLNEFFALHMMKYGHHANMIVVCTSECPELLPEHTAKFLLSHSKAEAAYGMMSMLLQSPFAASQDQYIALVRETATHD